MNIKKIIEPFQTVGTIVGVTSMCVVLGVGYTIHQFVVAPIVFASTGRTVFSKKEIEKFYGIKKAVQPL